MNMKPSDAEAILNNYHLKICDAFCKATCSKYHEEYKVRHVDNECVPNCCKPLANFGKEIKAEYDLAVKKLYKE